MAEKKAKGRQKILMRRIESEEDRLVTFSKRRSGIYKKATEISTLCGADVGILIFSPAGKPFTYGTPNIESIANRLMSRPGEDQGGGNNTEEALRKARLEDLNKTCDEMSAYLQMLKKEGKMLADEAKQRLEEAGEKASCWWWDVPVENLNAEEMKQMTVTMEELKRSATNRLQDLVGEASTSAIPNQVNGNGMGIASGNVFRFGN